MAALDPAHRRHDSLCCLINFRRLPLNPNYVVILSEAKDLRLQHQLDPHPPTSSLHPHRRSGRSRLQSVRLNRSRESPLTKYKPARPTYFMCTLAHLRNPAVAIATILAMLIVPACGSLCAAMNHCATSTVSSNSDGCHHADMSIQSDPDALSLSSPASCGQQAPLLAVLTDSGSSIQVKSIATAIAPFAIIAPEHAITLNSSPNESLSAKESPHSIPLENLSVLRV
jgi:hypothetical protein